MDETILWYLSLFFLPFTITLLTTPLISKFALNHGIVDKPGLHKTHSKAKPLLGGISIFVSFAAILLFFLPLDGKLLSLAVATVILVVTGLFDDLYDIKPLLKLSGQTAAAAIVVLWNADLFSFMIEYFAKYYLPGFVVLFLLIGWIVLMVNAFNLIDGMDGLAAGTAIIIFLSMAALSYIEGGRLSILAVQLVGAGACFGFLVFNFYPARIFMGDTGSMMLGFILAASHLYVIKYPFSTQLVLGSMFLFAYPALDVSYAIYRRLCNRCSILKADKGHIHHVLVSMGFSIKKSVMIIYMVNIVFSSIGVLLMVLEMQPRFLFAIGVLTFIFTLLLFKKMLLIGNMNGFK